MQGGGSKNSNIASGSSSGNKSSGGDLFLPIANMLRIMRKVLPAQAKISDESKETIQECVSEFIMFVTSEANDKCRVEQRKTVTADDLLWAIAKLGFHDYVDPLSLFIRRYRQADLHRPNMGPPPLPLSYGPQTTGPHCLLQDPIVDADNGQPGGLCE